jgi:hypothetical protein
LRTSISAADANRQTPITIAALPATLRTSAGASRGGSNTSNVSAAAMPSGNGSF